jgi:hypothetical protein
MVLKFIIRVIYEKYNDFFLSICGIFFFDVNAYEIIFERLEVSPGCEGGVEYTITKSRYVSSMGENLKTGSYVNNDMDNINSLNE